MAVVINGSRCCFIMLSLHMRPAAGGARVQLPAGGVSTARAMQACRGAVRAPIPASPSWRTCGLVGWLPAGLEPRALEVFEHRQDFNVAEPLRPRPLHDVGYLHAACCVRKRCSRHLAFGAGDAGSRVALPQPANGALA